MDNNIHNFKLTITIGNQPLVCEIIAENQKIIDAIRHLVWMDKEITNLQHNYNNFVRHFICENQDNIKLQENAIDIITSYFVN